MHDLDTWTPITSAYDVDEAIVDRAVEIASEYPALDGWAWAAVLRRLEAEPLPDGRRLDFGPETSTPGRMVLRRRVREALREEGRA